MYSQTCLSELQEGDEITDDEIRKTVAEAISSSGIEKLVTGNEFQRAIAHLFRQLESIEVCRPKRGD